MPGLARRPRLTPPPRITDDIAERHPPAGYVAALDLAASIVASTDGRPTDPAVVRREYADTMTRLHDLADRNLALADGDVEFVYGLQALMAFEDPGVWQRHLNHVADGELPVECRTAASS